jgi:hypothetical protein
MNKNKNQRADAIGKVNDHYRIVFINDDTLQEVISFRLTMKKLYVLFSTLFVIVVTLTTCMLLLTPLKYYIPGYGNRDTHLQAVKLKRNVDSLGDLIAAQQAYELNLRKLINGDYNGKTDTTRLDLNRVKTEAMNFIPAQKELNNKAHTTDARKALKHQTSHD